MSFHDETAARLQPSAADVLVKLSDIWVNEKAAMIMKSRISSGAFASPGTDEAKLAGVLEFVSDINKVFKSPWQKSRKS